MVSLGKCMWPFLCNYVAYLMWPEPGRSWASCGSDLLAGSSQAWTRCGPAVICLLGKHFIEDFARVSMNHMENTAVHLNVSHSSYWSRWACNVLLTSWKIRFQRFISAHHSHTNNVCIYIETGGTELYKALFVEVKNKAFFSDWAVLIGLKHWFLSCYQLLLTLKWPKHPAQVNQYAQVL